MKEDMYECVGDSEYEMCDGPCVLIVPVGVMYAPENCPFGYDCVEWEQK